MKEMTKSLKDLFKQIMKSFPLSGPKFDIAAEMFCVVEFSNFLLGQKFVVVTFFSKNGEPPLPLFHNNFSHFRRCRIWMNTKIGPKKANFVKGAQHPPLAMPNGTNTPVSHIILNGSMYKWNPASGILNELSDCILYRQTNGT